MCISWHHVRAEVLSPQRRVILDDACGSASQGRVLAVLGPSGAGKSTLLQALAGRLAHMDNLHLSGVVEPASWGGTAPASFIYQEDAFHSRLSVKETLHFAAALRLPRNKVDVRVAEVLRMTGLSDVAASAVGSTKVRGISGGERKRLAIGCELVANAHSPLFADEPTSGLDSFQALRILEALSAAAESRVVMLSVHQPSARLLQCCGDTLLLGAGGRTLYIGPTSEMQLAIESQQRVTIGAQPPMSSTAEWMLEAASIDPSAEEKSSHRTTSLAEAWREKQQAQQLPQVAQAASFGHIYVAPWQTQLYYCLWRSWRQHVGSRPLFIMRVVSTLVTGIVFGSIFWQLHPSDVKGRVGLLQVLCNYLGMTSTLRSVRVLQDGEAIVVYRERASGVLRLLPYFVGKSIAELPMSFVLPTLLIAVAHPMATLKAPLLQLALLFSLEGIAAGALGLAAGASASSLDMGLEGAKAVMTIFTIFGGLYFDKRNLPWLLQWVPNTSIIHISWDGAVAIESMALAEYPQGAVAATSMSTFVTRDNSVVELACIAAALYTVAFVALVLKAPRFQQVMALPKPLSSAQFEFRQDSRAMNSCSVPRL